MVQGGLQKEFVLVLAEKKSKGPEFLLLLLLLFANASGNC